MVFILNHMDHLVDAILFYFFSRLKKIKAGKRIIKFIKRIYQKVKGTEFEDKMKSILDSKDGVEVEFIKITLKPDEKSQKLVDGIYYIENEKLIEINPLECKDIDVILREFAEKGLLFEEKNPLVIHRVKMKIEDMYEFPDTKQRREILEFYKGKIPEEDWEALRVALLIRDKFRKKQDI